MARIKANITILAGWQPEDELVLMIGSENVASLALSTPAGGVEVASLPVGDAIVGQAVTLEHDYDPTDKCASLPVGAATRDTQGNLSAAFEGVINLRDPPEGVPRPTIAATANPNEALIAWTLSPDVG